MAIEIRKRFRVVLLCLSIVLCLSNVALAQQFPKEPSTETVESVPLKTTATIADLKTNVPTDEFHKQVPALRELDRKIVGMNFMSISGDKSSAAKEIHFENSKGESGKIRIFTKVYTQMQTSFDLEVYRVQIDSNKRYVLWTVAVQPMGGADSLSIMFNETDPIDPTHDARDPETTSGCFDASVTHCPPNPKGSNPSGPGGPWDKCFREMAHEISKCVGWEGFTESCAISVASAIGTWCP
jgi:hypothetical protein